MEDAIQPDAVDEMILGLLAEGGEVPVPSELLCGKLDLSATEVLRSLARLRGLGYRIDRAGRGYRLVQLPDRVTALELHPFLGTRALGRELHHLESVDSTNATALALGREGAFHGTTVVAEHQRRGRGRRGRTWISPAGRNLYCSVILRPEVEARRAPELTFVAAVAIAETLREGLEVPVRLKWPNDVEVDGRKLVGILPELESDGDRVSFVVLGFGINVNMTEDELPEALRARATSLRMVLGERVDRPLLAAALLSRLEDWYQRWLDGGLAPVLDAWRRLSGTLGERVRVETGRSDRDFEGRAVDLAPDGALVVQLDGGEERRVVVGDVVHLRRA